MFLPGYIKIHEVVFDYLQFGLCEVITQTKPLTAEMSNKYIRRRKADSGVLRVICVVALPVAAVSERGYNQTWCVAKVFVTIRQTSVDHLGLELVFLNRV